MPPKSRQRDATLVSSRGGCKRLRWLHCAGLAERRGPALPRRRGGFDSRVLLHAARRRRSRACTLVSPLRCGAQLHYADEAARCRATLPRWPRRVRCPSSAPHARGAGKRGSSSTSYHQQGRYLPRAPSWAGCKGTPGVRISGFAGAVPVRSTTTRGVFRGTSWAGSPGLAGSTPARSTTTGCAPGRG